MWFAETLARLQRSIPPILNTVYGADPEASGHEVRDFHRPIKGRMPDGSPYSALNPGTYYWAHACFVEHLITATDTFIRRLSRGREGAALRGVPHLVRALRRQLTRHSAHLRRVRGLLRGGPGRAAGRAPDRVVRRGLRDQGLAASPAGAAAGLVAGQAADQRDQRLDHDRRHATTREGDPGDALGRAPASGATSASPGSVARSTVPTAGCPAGTGCTRSPYAPSNARPRAPDHPRRREAVGTRQWAMDHRARTPAGRPCTKGAWLIAHPWDCSTPTR